VAATAAAQRSSATLKSVVMPSTIPSHLRDGTDLLHPHPLMPPPQPSSMAITDTNMDKVNNAYGRNDPTSLGVAACSASAMAIGRLSVVLLNSAAATRDCTGMAWAAATTASTVDGAGRA
jgi:hypothetical protein